jgi:hypothetical protein
MLGNIDDEIRRRRIRDTLSELKILSEKHSEAEKSDLFKGAASCFHQI